MAETMTETNLRASLKKVLQDWIDEQTSNDLSKICYVGENTSSSMADAAFAVLQGMADLEKYFRDEGMI